MAISYEDIRRLDLRVNDILEIRIDPRAEWSNGMGSPGGIDPQEWYMPANPKDPPEVRAPTLIGYLVNVNEARVTLSADWGLATDPRHGQLGPTGNIRVYGVSLEAITSINPRSGIGTGFTQ